MLGKGLRAEETIFLRNQYQILFLAFSAALKNNSIRPVTQAMYLTVVCKYLNFFMAFLIKFEKKLKNKRKMERNLNINLFSSIEFIFVGMIVEKLIKFIKIFKFKNIT
ncbi:hypothetical protein BpHYR1_007690 [Brachionus plicatilis]|uniref:Uncharacterized protein n=1 Tax=Brachionus plicatilis TaxID=10195 RepID=A0A3M7SPG7_BRAPC|nr:hypothetical protein BpHYR1_007690 [Brachionus plicatilis]